MDNRGRKKRIQANRRNGSASNGPTSEQGKEISARNSLKHGLTAGEALVPTEDPKLYEGFCDRLRAELNPGTELELVLVERIIELAWRLRRVANIEAGILTWRYHDLQQNEAMMRIPEFVPRNVPEEEWRPNERNLVNESKHRKAKASDLAMIGDAFTRDTEALAKLSRYEASISRNLFRTLHELERRQAARQGKDVPVPLALDIDVAIPDSDDPEVNER